MAESADANQAAGIYEGFEFDSLFQGFDENSVFHFDLNPFPEPLFPDFDTFAIQIVNSSSPDISKLKEGGVWHDNGVPDFFSDMLDSRSDADKKEAERSKAHDEDNKEETSVGVPDLRGDEDGDTVGKKLERSDADKKEAERPKAHDEESKKETSVGVPDLRGDEDGDSVGKKLERKMKNRESAMRSRERKKAHIKDLETRSKYLESECNRLDYIFRYCLAENKALHKSLQIQNRLHDAFMAKQESAALFVESLLLGSLFWLMIIIACLLLIPTVEGPHLKALSMERKGFFLEVVKLKKTRSDSDSQFVSLRRRYRSLRVRMKLSVSTTLFFSDRDSLYV